MHSKVLLAALAASPAAVAAETVLGVYVFHRHGDRTPKSFPPASLTPLGADEVHQSGDFYRARYVNSGASDRIDALSADAAKLSQLFITSPQDGVLYNSAMSFLQGLYPPRGDAGNETLADGRQVQAPLGGYQYIPVDAVAEAATVAHAENNAWLQGNSGCANAEVSSQSYLNSAEFNKSTADSKDFYQSLLPVINGTVSAADATFKNAYTIFDLINVATIHNKTIPSGDLVKPAMPRLLTLASTHEWNLAYNASEPVRAIAGAVLAGQILDSLNALATGQKAPTFNAQFGAYGTFMSFFGLAQMPAANPDFYGICDYASSMAFELVTNATKGSDGKYSEKDLSVRFFFSNGTATTDSFKQYPLFAQKETTLSWPDFKTGISKFAIQDDAKWCAACGGNSGKCAGNSTSSQGGSASTKSTGGSGGVSRPVAGVIGALVTLAVVLGLQAAIMLFGGFRLMKKSALRPAANSEAAMKA